MRALTVRLADEKHHRLKALIQGRGRNLNQKIYKIPTLMMPGIDAETRFQLRAARGAGKEQRGLELLAKAQIRAESEQG